MSKAVTLHHNYANPEIRDIDIDGQTLRLALRKGEGGGVPLVMINGIGAEVDSWEPLARRMHDVDIITFDAPGTGGSPLPAMPYTIVSMATMLAKLITKLGYQQVDVLGFSWGGFVAQQFAQQHPAMCRRVVLAATATSLMPYPNMTSFLDRIFNFSDTSKNVNGGQAGFNKAVPELMKEFMSLTGNAADMMGLSYQMMAAMGWSSAFFLHQMKQPTLILLGRSDPIATSFHGNVLKWLIPNSRLETVDGGHLFLVTNADVSGELIRHFFEGDAPKVDPVSGFFGWKIPA